ncbi:hypothetical protein [Pseudoalteromonas sp. OOF1S-7]|uniref:hypothetical protein n=1 Tax=Pseudoalteromonas sp. OOF1S-7 TaxID=2917757 RepID=UPI001EF7178B|nr:hypothetical protein [Pseudoalteromonas sp. OOF1S-7]MCG7537914.1 hypothetical protein [Pseudoalteromonas sp. OOF1S-7]
MNILDDEYLHIKNNTLDGIDTCGLLKIKLRVRCNGDAAQVLDRAKEVMLTLLSCTKGKCFQYIKWTNALPSWFVQCCGRELSSDELEEYLSKWRLLSPEEQEKMENEQDWSLDDWLYWLEPEQRTWYWWSSNRLNDDLFELVIVVRDWPTAIGSLEWLLKASGANDVALV